MALNWTAPKYFETLGTPLLAGRDFTFEDQGRPPVAIVSQSMARYHFGDRSPIGQLFTFERRDNRGRRGISRTRSSVSSATRNI